MNKIQENWKKTFKENATTIKLTVGQTWSKTCTEQHKGGKLSGSKLLRFVEFFDWIKG